MTCTRFSAVIGGFALFSSMFLLPVLGNQIIGLNGDAGGKRFDGIGAVSGGGATSVLLKDYPEPERSQILDLLFKPKFGASMSALLVEVPGDGNSTQGAEPSHMHTHDDLSYRRGYEWWLMREARKRNPELSLDACAWGCPGWVGGGHFWSQDMCDYYVKWIQGLKTVYGLDLDAIGCRNEKGVNEDFAKKFRATLDAAGLKRVRIHGFDNWDKTKFDWTRDVKKDPELEKAVAIFSNHTMADAPTPDDVRRLAESLHKPIWNSEEHVYKKGFDCEISIVKAFNENFIRSGVTKIVNWYLVAALYPMESYSEDPAAMIANSPWSGHYSIREALWGYAHYGQFSKIGWQYLNGACGTLAEGGTYVTLKSAGEDYSVILETKGATNAQDISFTVSGGLSSGKLCVWRSDASEQFVHQGDITPTNGTFNLALAANSIYSISTTTGQQKGSFRDVPAAADFPLPYCETFEEYTVPGQWGCLPHYTADIDGIFEISERPDKSGKCLRQVVSRKAQSWAPEWVPYTIIGDEHWQDYAVSADVYLDGGGAAGVMGRVNNVGYGYGCVPKGYYMELAEDGGCKLYAATQSTNDFAGSQLLATGAAANVSSNQWHNVQLRFLGNVISGFVDGTQICSVTNALYSRGMAGLIAGEDPERRNTASFDNLLITAPGASAPAATVFSANQSPIYSP